MNLALLVGISHRTAPVELRERVDFSARGVADALRALAGRGSTREAVIVSTCNRAEVYVACDEAAATRADVERFIAEFNDVAAADIAPHIYELDDLEAARHLFRVAAGLDSLVVGEPQILGQVKDAHAAAAEAHSVGPGAQPRVSLVVRRRQTGADGNGSRRGRRVGELRGRGARAKDLRRSRRA